MIKIIENIKYKLQNIKFEQKCLIAIFLFMLCINMLAPITGDDWGNAASKFTLVGSIESAIGYYKFCEGRIIGRILINFMASRKLIYNILTPLIIVSIIHSAYKLIENKKNQRYLIILFIISLLLVNRHTFGQSYIWIAGGVTYLYPTAIVLGIMAHLFNKKEEKFKLLESIILIFLSLIGTCFVENIGVALVFSLLLYNIYNYIINKKIQVVPIICLICSIVTLIAMVMSPGSASRLTETPEFNELSIIEKVISNVDNCREYLYTRNAVLVLLMLIPINNVIYKKIKRKSIKIPLLILIDAYCITSILQMIQYMIPVNIHRLEFGEIFILNAKKITIPFWTIFTAIFVFSIIDAYKEDKKKLIINIILVLTGLSSILCMLISPVWGDRISILNTIIFYIISISLIGNIIEIKKLEKVLIGILVCVFIYYLIIFIDVANTQYKREQEIAQCIENNETVLYLTKSPIAIMQNFNPQAEFFVRVYKLNYNIPENVEIRLKIPDNIEK